MAKKKPPAKRARVSKSARHAVKSRKAKSTKKKVKKKKSASSVASQLDEPTPLQIKAAKSQYARALIAHGQAIPQGTKLTPGATHEIVGQDAEGTPIVKRRRFSLK
jgi:hypothetical protein